MANLVIDIGNTFIKLAVFDGQNISWTHRYRQLSDLKLQTILDRFKPQRAMIASVQKVDFMWQLTLAQQIKTYRFNHQMAKAVKNHYQQPETLGLDRLAAVIGASQLYPQQANLVIDAGTCITYDYVDKNSNYYGGSISPGLKMRFKALKHYTKKLPLINAEPAFDANTGKNTREAILSGVQAGLLYEVHGFIKSHQQQGDMNVILTGGDLIFFDTHLKNSIFAAYLKAEPNLVLMGLNAVLLQQE